MDEIKEALCSTCAGSGEGMHEGWKCNGCQGSGVLYSNLECQYCDKPFSAGKILNACSKKCHDYLYAECNDDGRI